MRGNVKVAWEHVEMCPVFEETIEEPDGLAVPLVPWAASETPPMAPAMWRHWLYIFVPSAYVYSTKW